MIILSYFTFYWGRNNYLLLCKDMNYTKLQPALDKQSGTVAAEMIPSIFFQFFTQTQALTVWDLYFCKLALFMAFRYKETKSAGKIVVKHLSEILPIKHSQLFASKLEIYLT